MKIAVFWGGAHTLPGACDWNTFYSFYNSGWQTGFNDLGHEVAYFSWDDEEDHPGYDLYIYAPGFLTQSTFHKNLHHPNIFFTEEASLGISWAVSHSFYYDSMAFLDFMNWKSMKAQGIKNAFWVPGAVDQKVFQPLEDVVKDRTVSFLGNFDNNVIIEGGRTRFDYIKAIDAKVPGSLVCKGKYAYEGNKIWNAAKIGVDVPIVDFCSFRLFQIIAAGCFCITRRSRVPSGIEFLLPKDQCYFGLYGDLEDLIGNCIPESLNLIDVFPRAISKTREYVLENNTFKERARQLLQIAGFEKREEKLFYLEENIDGEYHHD